MNSEARNKPASNRNERDAAESVAAPAAPPPHPPTPPELEDAPLQLEPDTDDERPGYGWAWNQAVARQAREEQQHAREAAAGREAVRRSAEQARSHDAHVNGASDETISDHVVRSGAPHSGMGAEAGHMSDILRWALDSIHEPALAAADWLARDIDPDQPSATALLTSPAITFDQVKQAKSVFKTMRIVGEKSADRRVGARMYAAAIAAALVRHKQFITSQSDDALKRAFQGLLDDRRMPGPLRDLAGMALCALADKAHASRTRRQGQKASRAGLPDPAESSSENPIPMPRAMPRPQGRRKRG